MNLVDDNLTSPMEDGFEGAKSQPATAGENDDKDWIRRFKSSLNTAQTFQTEKLAPSWSRSYRAFQNRHMNGTKYDFPSFKKRSKLFKPKTRGAVRKNDASAAEAMFSTQDVVSITAERAGDKLQAMTASFLHQALNYRLDSAHPLAGPNWFMTAIGARQDAQLTGICVSKQFWEFEERTAPAYVKVKKPMLDGTGTPVLDLNTGAPVMEDAEDVQDVTKTVRDRPMITLIPGEQAFIDPTGDWRDPIQEGGYFCAAFPARRNDIEAIITQQATRNKMGGGAWRENIDLDNLIKGSANANSKQVREQRDDGGDRYETRHGDKNSDTLWLYEFFYREDGQDWHMWMLGEGMLLSDPRPTEEAYPEQKGMRPYTRGVGAVESHKTHPMAPVESWQPMQNEINDITNLNLDAMKMAISPITTVKRGAGVDLKQVANRGPDGVIMVSEDGDVVFDRAPSPDRASVEAVNVIANDFDDLAGVFSGGSVQQNRQLNETVGGMQMLSGNANALTKFDLKVWNETWAEPTLAQMVNCIRYYESDPKVIAVAGERCGLVENLATDPSSPQAGVDPAAQADPNSPQNQPPGQPPMPPMQPGQPPQDPSMQPPPPGGPMMGHNGGPPMPPPAPKLTIQDVLGNLDSVELSVRINIGTGAIDSQQKMQKFGMAMKMTTELGPLLADQGIVPNGAALVQEIWGMADYKDADRFFTTKPKQPPAEPPEVTLKKMDIQAQGAKSQLEAKTKMDIERIEAGLEQQRIQLEAQAQAHQQHMDQMNAHLERQNAMVQQQHGTVDRILSAFQAKTGADTAQAGIQNQQAQMAQDGQLAQQALQAKAAAGSSAE